MTSTPTQAPLSRDVIELTEFEEQFLQHIEARSKVLMALRSNLQLAINLGCNGNSLKAIAMSIMAVEKEIDDLETLNEH